MRLNSISETGALTLGYKANAASSTWAYDNNGNVTARTNVSVTNIGYNHLNLPDYFTNSGGAEIINTYDASGRKWSGNAAGVATHYFGEIEYENNNLQAVYHEDGRIVPLSGTTYEYHFYLKDHLGNVRTVVKGTGAAPMLMQEYHYYPFGMAMDGNWVTPTGLGQKYRYNGKELVDDLGLNGYDYGARWYEASVGRWMQVDPLSEEYANHSPYDYGLNHPVRVVDPDGKGAIVKKIYDEKNKLKGFEVSAKVYIYGEAAGGGTAMALAQRVNDMLSTVSAVDADGNVVSSSSTVDKGSTTYDVSFNITFESVSTEDAQGVAQCNPDQSVNFLYVYDDENESRGSGFKGNSGFLNLADDRTRNNTTSPHEIMHMMGFRSNNPDDNTHFKDDEQGNILLKDGLLPLMYSGRTIYLGGRATTKADIAGLNLTKGFVGRPKVKTKYIGEANNSVVFKNREELKNYKVND